MTPDATRHDNAGMFMLLVVSMSSCSVAEWWMCSWCIIASSLYGKVCVGLRGPDLGSTLIIQTNTYTTVPFGISSRSADESLTRSSMGGCWNKVSAPWDGCDVIWFPLSLSLHGILRSRACEMSPLFQPSIPPRKGMIGLRAALAYYSCTFTQLWQRVVQIPQLI